ncbi:branched-chain amino acid ABC transporter permease [Nonomuraea sp. LPB2021202275-12-8]|uniref:branched-chain amino acid ABC transporter permease n=1 Tax=Nonomuraea sp. LPB2021202275-12-8 TaxID=3120159 RepID=UPI00300D2885
MLQALINGVTDGMLIGLTALGISLVYAVQRFPNVSQGGLVTAGAYAAYAFGPLVGTWYLAIGAGVLSAFVLGMLGYLIVIRPFRTAPLMTLLIVTIGLEFVLDYTVSFFWGNSLRAYDFGVTGEFSVGGLYVSRVAAYTSLVALATMAVVATVVRRTRIGREMRALSDDKPLARVARISENRTLMLAWGAAGALAAVAGICYGVKSQLSPLMGWNLLLPSFAAAILGGLGSFGGAILGGVVVGVGMELFTLAMPAVFKPIFAFLVLTLLLLVRPQGLLGKAVRV